tara:strand:- start:1437 stop:2321 length:885 start_codon:yes stop_codon:yes gene_type:complete
MNSRHKILVTGGSGFIGADVIKQLNFLNFKVLALSRKDKKNNKNIVWLKSNLNLNNSNLKKILKFKPNIVIHLAWDKIPFFSNENCVNNLFNSITFFKKITKIKSIHKVIVSGSCFEYSNKKGEKKESEINLPNDYFSLSKYLLFLYLKKLFKNNIKLAWFRIFYAYGPKQRKKSLIPYLIQSIKKKNVIKLKSPKIKNDFIFVEDVAKVIIKSISLNFKTGIYNLGTGTSVDANKIIKIISKKLNKKTILEKSSNKNKFFFKACMRKTRKTFKIKNFKTINYGIDKILFKTGV